MDGIGQFAQARATAGLNLLPKTKLFGEIGQEAIKGFASNAIQGFNSKDGDLVDKLLAGTQSGFNGAMVGGYAKMLPEKFQNDILGTLANIALDKSINLLKENEQDIDPPPFINSDSVKEIVLKNGTIQKIEQEPDRYLLEDAEDVNQNYPLPTSLKPDFEEGAMQLPSATIPAMTVVNGKLFLGGDPRDPRNWTAAQGGQ